MQSIYPFLFSIWEKEIGYSGLRFYLVFYWLVDAPFVNEGFILSEVNAFNFYWLVDAGFHTISSVCDLFFCSFITGRCFVAALKWKERYLACCISHMYSFVSWKWAPFPCIMPNILRFIWQPVSVVTSDTLCFYLSACQCRYTWHCSFYLAASQCRLLPFSTSSVHAKAWPEHYGFKVLFLCVVESCKEPYMVILSWS